MLACLARLFTTSPGPFAYFHFLSSCGELGSQLDDFREFTTPLQPFGHSWSAGSSYVGLRVAPGALFALGALGALGVLGAQGDLGALGALGALITLGALRALVALGAVGALGALGALVALVALVALGALGAVGLPIIFLLGGQVVRIDCLGRSMWAGGQDGWLLKGVSVGKCFGSTFMGSDFESFILTSFS